MRPLSFPGPLPRTPAAVPPKLTRNGRSPNAVGTEAGRYRLEDAGLSERSSAWTLEEPPTQEQIPETPRHRLAFGQSSR